MDPKEFFEELRDRYDAVYGEFKNFRFHSPYRIKHRKTLDSFMHKTNGLAANVGHAVLKGTLPEYGIFSQKWIDYNTLRTNVGLMELILELWDNTDGLDDCVGEED